MVFVVDKHKKPLMPCVEKRARKLLTNGKAVVHKRFPFTIRLKERTTEQSVLQPQTLKVDDGAKVTGFAIVRENAVQYLGELHHKQGISQKMQDRASLRRGRRNRKTRYRRCKFPNRKGQASVNQTSRPVGWLAPSLQSRVQQVENLILKLKRYTPIETCIIESVKFDMQLMENAEISGVEYQQGALHGYQVREYLLEKFGRRCAYCEITSVPLEIEHVVAKSKGGSNRVSNLTLACRDCNEEKDNLSLTEWSNILQTKNDKRSKTIVKNIPSVHKQCKQTLKYASHVNSTRRAIVRMAYNHIDEVFTSNGAVTKYNRTQLNLPKTHYYDAVSIYEMPSAVFKTHYFNEWHCKGRGSRQMCNVNKYGFPISNKQRKKFAFGFQTGDMVIANVTSGKKQGVYVGRVLVRHSGSFDIKDNRTGERIQGISYKHFKRLQRFDGYQYVQKQKI